MKASYITDSIRGYILAEECGADTASLSAMRGEITAALLAADPELSNTAATFRFHKLVAEMRDNDSITPQPAPAAMPEGTTADEIIYVGGDEVWYLGDTKRIPGGVLQSGDRGVVKVGNEDYEDDVQVIFGDAVVRVQPYDLSTTF